jgi:hypothetical protein
VNDLPNGYRPAAIQFPGGTSEAPINPVPGLYANFTIPPGGEQFLGIRLFYFDGSFFDAVGHPFENDIWWLQDAGLTTGCGVEWSYCPDDAVTREQMASFLVRALKLPATSTDFFTDDEFSRHESDINRAAAAGVTTGCGGGRYCPRQTVTREQMASFLARALKLPVTISDFFTDDETSIHEADINRAAAAGITTGCGGGRYCPKSAVTRGQMAAFLRRALT